MIFVVFDRWLEPEPESWSSAGATAGAHRVAGRAGLAGTAARARLVRRLEWLGEREPDLAGDTSREGRASVRSGVEHPIHSS